MHLKMAIEPAVTHLSGRRGALTSAASRERLTAAIHSSGGVVTALDEAEALMWLTPDAASLTAVLDAHPQIRWVQLPWAGVDMFVAAGLMDRPIIFTCAKAAYSGQVAEHALTLMLATLRPIVRQARAAGWCEAEPESLADKRVTILGAGGIARRLVEMLTPLGCRVAVLRRAAEPVPGADETLSIDALSAVLGVTDVLVLALSLTPETHHIVNSATLDLLPSSATVINVARGPHVDTEALVDALKNKRLRGAGLDVTDPEPLPADHPLWAMDNVLITSHCSDAVTYIVAKLAERLSDNVARFSRGEPLVGRVDAQAGY